MVPDRQHPADEARAFSPDVEAALESAMLELWTGGDPPAALRAALRAAAHDAKERLLRAEEMLVAFKRIETRAAARRAVAGREPEDRLRMVRALNEAYYSD